MEEQMSFNELQEIVSVMIDEVVRLKQREEENQLQIQEMNKIIAALISQYEKFATDFQDTKENIATSLRIQDYGLTNIKYELADPTVPNSSFYYPNIFPIEKTIDDIVMHGASLSRFGDGEFAIMAGRRRQKFQQMDKTLQKRLIEVFQSQEEKILIAIADNYGNLDKFSRAGKSGIRAYMTEEIRLEHKQFLDLSRTYHNAYISRPCVLYADCETEEPGKRFRALQRIWDNRSIIMIEGEQTRLGVGNDLFSNAKRIRRIEGPAENSFVAYDRILETALQNAEDDILFLLAMGPTASVLAYDLAMQGYQAVDIGHLDLEYEWYLKGGKRCQVDFKYNNEVPGGEKVNHYADPVYESQILERCL